ncbi:unnamed protein product [Cladocopium goreaui]|uniref:Pentatricopeptide repeat-containing protein, chloroplastic n=1 Tax=Cladocopium goreaui TaxID=2562237 RepID=A0A9P1DVB7_9DINO|nr:unnamed protein product [Cladocopium goreaui]
MWESALVLAQEMQAGRISLDLVSYNATMSACEKGQAWQYALGLLFQMPSLRLLPDVVSFNAAIVACEQGSKWELAPSLLTVMADSQVPPDLLTYNSMITAYVSGVQWEMALSTLTEASSHSFKPNTISFSAAITACEKGCQWEMALDVLQGMPQAMALPNLVSFNAAISACEKGWRWEEAVAIFQRLPEKSLVPDLISYNAVISACEKGAQWKMALHLLFRMDEGQLFPDEISFNSATIACEKAGAWQAAFHILEHMLVLQLLPDAVFAGSATSALRAARGPVKATHFLRSLRRFWQPCYAQPPDSQAIVAKGAGVIAIFKPAGVTTEDFVAPLREQSQPVDVLQIVSRLDHPTSGVLPLAVGTAGSMEANWLRGQFAGRLVFKEYLCLCEGPALGEAGVEGTIDAPLLTKEIDGVSRSEVSEVFGREAITKYTVVARYRPKQPAAQEATDREVMLLAVRPKTGRTHQIRVHMASIDCPLAGDLTYGFRAQNSSVRCPRLFLHCRRIQLLDINDDVFSAEAQLPRELTEVIETLDPLG